MATTVEHLIHEQYTGIKDKTGRDIYENDLLVTDEANWVGRVVFEDGGYFIRGGGWFSALSDGLRWEVVGSIHENKELLK